ncbi:PAS domain S-box protein [Coleofasciculus sp. LEGE 07092]|nr:PAS domain S-box protein [Coleofasciculus sp. LEGE 07081]MBE9148616.1 PAS domain S-box protein [Coleofasciculus sp. LEGE 07092]
MQTDVTERKQAEVALRESNTRIINILESITDGFFALDKEWRFTYLNLQAERLLQSTRAELLGQTVWDKFSEAVGYKFYPEYHKAVSQQISVEFEEFYPPLNTWFAVHAYPSKEGLSVYFQDISQRKQAEQKIRFQAALLDITTDAILVRDLEGLILFWNQGASRLYGWQAEESLGKNALQLLYQRKTPQLAEAFKTVVLNGKWQGELPQVTKNGKTILVESRWTLMLDEKENPTSILVVNTDITEQKQLEAQFLRAQRLESIGTLASGITHDLNNILTPILASAQLLLQAQVPVDKKPMLLETIESSARRGAALVKQVLSFARGVEGKHTALQMRHLVLEIRQIVYETFPKFIEFHSDISQNLWMVSGDATQLHQVLMNLCVNARDAMPHGGTLTLSATNRLIDDSYARMNLDARVGSYVAITVSDTGMGMSAEVVERIFEPFFTTKELGKGTGLGLSTVLTIVKSHGGFLEVTSAVDEGTQISAYLPAIEAEQSPQTEESALPLGQGELILVVDDEAAIRETNKTSLEAYNYRVLTANDGIEAIALYVQHKEEVGLVLVDMMMPLMDGATTIRTLEKINPQVKIIAVSGLVSNNQLAQSPKSSVQAFLSKPYTAQDLLQAIDEVLRGTGVQGEEFN